MRPVLLALYLLATPSLLPGATDPPAQDTLNVGYSAQAVATAPLWVTQESGAFKKYGLDVRPIFLAGGLAPVAVLTGDVQFATMSAGVLIPPVLRGADLVMVASFTNHISHALVVAPDIVEPRQLKGKRIAVQRLGDLTHIAAREAVKHLGLAEADPLYQQIGGVPTRFAALQSLVVQGAILTPPYIGRAQKMGFRVLVNLYDLKIPFSGASVVTTRRLIASRRAVALRFLKAVAEGIDFYKRERVASMRMIDRHLRGLPHDELAEAMEHYIRDLDDRPYPRPEGLKIALDLVAQQEPAARGAEPERFLDASLLLELEREGFFATLQRAGK
jgi:ABC-type nitrate/sulfonate/bicarbonate transport system substrate-binding protein